MFKCTIPLISACVFKNIHLNKTHPHFQAIGDRPNDQIINIDFGGDNGARIKVFTNDVCDAFPNLATIWANTLGIEEIQSNAFASCKNLKKLYFQENNLTEFDSDLLKGNQKLEELNFRENNLKAFDMTVLNNTPNLEILDLHRNLLTEFDVKSSPILQSMVAVFIEGNSISDIDEHIIIEKYPNLKKIFLMPNKFSESRLNELEEFFHSKSITTQQ